MKGFQTQARLINNYIQPGNRARANSDKPHPRQNSNLDFRLGFRHRHTQPPHAYPHVLTPASMLHLLAPAHICNHPHTRKHPDSHSPCALALLRVLHMAPTAVLHPTSHSQPPPHPTSLVAAFIDTRCRLSIYLDRPVAFTFTAVLRPALADPALAFGLHSRSQPSRTHTRRSP